LKLGFIFVSLLLSSCALLRPTATVRLIKVSGEHELNADDTTKTIFMFDSKINLDFDLNGSQRVAVDPGSSSLLADGIAPGWFYMDLIGASTWVRGLPVYLIGGDTVLIDVDNDYIAVDGTAFFTAQREKSTQFSYVPALSMRCIGCTRQPILKFDGQQVDYVPPWISVDAGWHTIEIYSPFDNVNLYYRALFDNYTETEFTFYPVAMN
jgi:hypothetical protein